jgi:hypothetical protein
MSYLDNFILKYLKLRKNKVKDYSLPYLVLQSLIKKYHDSMINQNSHRAYEIAVDMVEMAQVLQEIANDKNTT